MSAASKQLNKGDILFREGDPSDACYVVKSGKISITKVKGNAEIELANLGPGQMFGEMAFFDNKPRSAGAKASADATVIILPFTSLTQQFQTFPQWLKAMVKTINDNLREANKRIKNLEQASKGDDKMFPPYTITKLVAILTLVAHRYGEKQPDQSVALERLPPAQLHDSGVSRAHAQNAKNHRDSAEPRALKNRRFGRSTHARGL